MVCLGGLLSGKVLVTVHRDGYKNRPANDAKREERKRRTDTTKKCISHSTQELVYVQDRILWRISVSNLVSLTGVKLTFNEARAQFHFGGELPGNRTGVIFATVRKRCHVR